MANRYVRIYSKPEGYGEPATLLGFSWSAVPDDEGLDDFTSYLHTSGNTVREVDFQAEPDLDMLLALGGVSSFYLEIKPPLREEQLTDLGQLCTRHVTTGNNYGYLIDNRTTKSPFEPFDLRGKYIAKWMA